MPPIPAENRNSFKGLVAESLAPFGPGKRRAVACKACHSLKVKCIPSDPSNKSSPCVRCIKSKKSCEIDITQSRKKRKVEDNKVAELQNKIEHLKEQLRRAQHLQHDENSGEYSSPSPQTSPSTIKTGDSRTAATSNNSNSAQNTSNGPSIKSQPKRWTQSAAKSPSKLTLDDMVTPEEMAEASALVIDTAQLNAAILAVPLVDLIQDGLLTLEEAKQRFKLYHDVIMKRHSDVIVGDDFDQVRRETPILFTTVIAVTGMVLKSEDAGEQKINLEIENLASRQTIYQVLIVGNKTIEVLKSMILLTNWYNLPEPFHHRRYHIFSTVCIQLIQDLGLTGRPYYVVNKDEGSVKQSTILENPEKEEYKALVLSVYTTSIGYSLFLRRKFQVSWSPYLEECAQILSRSEENGYRSIATLAKLTAKLEKIHSLVDHRAADSPSLLAHFVDEVESLRKDATVTIHKSVFDGFVNSIFAFLYSKSSTVEMNIKMMKFCSDVMANFASLEPDDLCSVPFYLTGRLVYCYAAYLKISNLTCVQPDLELMQRIKLLIEGALQKYPSNTMFSKLRLLFFFYITTFSKNKPEMLERSTEYHHQDQIDDNASESLSRKLQEYKEEAMYIRAGDLKQVSPDANSDKQNAENLPFPSGVCGASVSKKSSDGGIQDVYQREQQQQFQQSNQLQQQQQQQQIHLQQQQQLHLQQQQQQQHQHQHQQKQYEQQQTFIPQQQFQHQQIQQQHGSLPMGPDLQNMPSTQTTYNNSGPPLEAQHNFMNSRDTPQNFEDLSPFPNAANASDSINVFSHMDLLNNPNMNTNMNNHASPQNILGNSVNAEIYNQDFWKFMSEQGDDQFFI